MEVADVTASRSRASHGAHRSATRAATITAAVGMVLANATAVGAGAVLLWYTAGTTVITGDGTTLTLVFFLCAVLHGVACVFAHRVASGAPYTATLVTVVSFSGGVIALVVLHNATQLYFIAWLAVFASLFVAASSAMSIVIGFLMSTPGKWTLHLIAAGVGVTGFLLERPLWEGNGLLVPLLLFVVGFVLCGRFFSMIFLVAGPDVLTGGNVYHDRRDQ